MPVGRLTRAPTRPRRSNLNVPERSTPTPRPQALADVEVTEVLGPTMTLRVSDVDVTSPSSSETAEPERVSPESSWARESVTSSRTAVPYERTVTAPTVVVARLLSAPTEVPLTVRFAIDPLPTLSVTSPPSSETFVADTDALGAVVPSFGQVALASTTPALTSGLVSAEMPDSDNPEPKAICARSRIGFGATPLVCICWVKPWTAPAVT